MLNTSTFVMALQTTFEDYMAILADYKECGGGEDSRLFILRDRERQIRAFVERCERTFEFRRLVKETKAAYAKRPDREAYDIWQTSVAHVLRRSRIYADVFDSDYCPKDLFKRLEDAFTKGGRRYIQKLWMRQKKSVSYSITTNPRSLRRGRKDTLDETIYRLRS